MMRLRYDRLAAEMRRLHSEIARAHARLDSYDAGWTVLSHQAAPGGTRPDGSGHDAAPKAGDES